MLQFADWLALGVVVSLPWSTSLTSILIALWLAAYLPALDLKEVADEIASAAGGLPILLWVLGALGMLWADVSWSARFAGFDSYHRLLVIPLLLAQFGRSTRGTLVLCGFLISASCVLVVSWIVALVPALAIYGKQRGVPVKDYIWQSEMFLICAFALLGAARAFWRDRSWSMAAMAIGAAAMFLANIAFVATGRTALVVAPVLIAFFGYRQIGLRGVVAALVGGAVLAGAAWFGSSYLRERVYHSFDELQAYRRTDAVNSTALHLEFLRKSLHIVGKAPLIGHGTGSIAEQFQDEAASASGVAGVLSVNPHDQVFAIGIEVGATGVGVLLIMWAAHFLLFAGDGLPAWAGAVVVVESVVSSLFNSHLFDFTQGWFYVFAVGIIGGTVLRERREMPASGH